jgi:hypothetical protein
MVAQCHSRCCYASARRAQSCTSESTRASLNEKPQPCRGDGSWGFHRRDGYATKHSRYEPSRLQVRFRYNLGRSRQADVWCTV